MTKILAIDTSTYVMGVALTEGEQLEAEIVTNKKENHSVRLMPAIRSLMDQAGWKPEHLDAIAVAQGPGSYTGVRIGVTTAKSMAWALDIPIIGVSSLEILAQNGVYHNGLVMPFFDARRGQVFTGLYRSENGRMMQVKEDRIVLLEEWLQEVSALEENVLALGPEEDKHREALAAGLGSLLTIPAARDHAARPSALAAAALYQQDKTEVHAFVPEYLRLAEAEAKWREQQMERQQNGR
ncbi:tRNA (adenosine(37)-N6)-threonylcarbamoyltransferase complex dimerization subunit type 1 TsaB [Alkalicoccus daliensis]|uniref:tRNA threonylcarbamoyladenosine biosynthesis protein TsaB n=1 Tax=Alkalicoccus daliensis TaxID=745820 RepID=A0A1H0H8W7_9BACI|nr:tRNA (adenosine(37)-N6)-threonylcarbamoyltransferase complex dimerization subunit type 1 TsaB [Alkalicoccus daliensis]SDO15656.1 tRNA threonylcarbamoyladenosine biosynthesis protein TsaB [Alkalicoccus daliensis]